MRHFQRIIVFLCTVLLSACGSGGGGGTGGSGAAQPTTAVLHLSTVYNQTGALPTGESIRGVTLTVNLPPGVNLKNDGIKTSTVTANKTALPQILENTSSTATTGGKVTVVFLTNPVGFGVGEFATMECSIATGSFPKAADFSQPTATTVTDLSFATITSLKVNLAADVN